MPEHPGERPDTPAAAPPEADLARVRIVADTIRRAQAHRMGVTSLLPLDRATDRGWLVDVARRAVRALDAAPGGAGTAAPVAAPDGEDDEVRCECGHVDTDHDANPGTGWGSCQACFCEGFQQAEEVTARAPREAPADPDEDDDTVPATWAGLVSILDRHYPPDVFTGATDDQGPRVVTLVRAVAGLRGQVAAVRALAEDAMKLPTLDDPRPASDFISPRAVLAALDGSGEAPADTARTAEESRLRAEVAALEAFSGPSTVEGERWVAEQYRRALARALGADPGLSMVSLILAAAARTRDLADTPAAPEADDEHCPRCDSPQPHLHPAVQHEGEVQVCPHPWHARTVLGPQTLSRLRAAAPSVSDTTEGGGS